MTTVAVMNGKVIIELPTGFNAQTVDVSVIAHEPKAELTVSEKIDLLYERFPIQYATPVIDDELLRRENIYDDRGI